MRYLSISLILVSQASAFSEKGLEHFEKEIRPLLVENCYRCHGADRQRGDLRVDSKEALLKGGSHGPAIVPGDPEKSLIIKAMRYTVEDLEMPPKGKLTDEEIAAMAHWIRIGAPWPKEAVKKPALGDQKAIQAAAEKHWAFQPVSKPEPPKVKSRSRVNNPIDAFVLARLEKAGLTLSPQADSATLIRRAHFTLTGLPPTYEEVQSKMSLSTIVDDLLKSPHYGERWARHWLDVARYADTRDWFPQIDTRYPYAYTYRDEVIKALNNDMPYDQFVKLQLAADFYLKEKDSRQLALMGFLMVGPRFRNNRNEQIADRIDVVTRGLMGLTVTCARCHDHKYDPIPTKDYYSLHGVFASCEEPESYPLIQGEPRPPELIRDYERERQEKIDELDAYRKRLVKEATEDFHRRIDEYFVGYYEMEVIKKSSIRKLISKRKLKETAMTPLARNLSFVLTRAQWRRHPVLAPWALLMKTPEPQFPTAIKRALGTPKLNPLVAAILRSNPKTKLELLSKYAALFSQALKAGMNAQGPIRQVSRLLTMERSPFTFDERSVVNASRLLAPGRIKLARLQNAIQQVDLTHKGAPPRAMVLVERNQPITPAVFIRGNPRRRGERVPRRFLSLIAGQEAKPFKDGSGRRELAEAIVDPKNPLTARVIVNRVWMHHFGEGLVTSPGDFGLRAEAPSHPQLLDWLASWFMDNGWSLKKLHRLILSSATWQQCSTPPESVLTKGTRLDADNRLLWHANRRRLDFESMRDSILVATGQLDRTMGGRPVDLMERPWSNRRTVYGFVDRVNLDDIFATFDFPSPAQSSPERPETVVPQQALFGMNHPFMVAQSRALASLPELRKLKGIKPRLGFLTKRLFGRAPTTQEIELTLKFLRQAIADPARPGQGIWQYGFGLKKVQRLHCVSWRRYHASKDFRDAKLRHVSVTAFGGHPGKDQEHPVVRRWTAPCDGVISVEAVLQHLRDKGDGIRGRIIAGRGGVLGEWTLLNQSKRTNIAQYKVKAGETIDFVVDCRKRATSDAFRWAPTIRLIEGQTEGRRLWSARSDFASPPPPPLNPWAQVAQALLLTTAFMFVD